MNGLEQVRSGINQLREHLGLSEAAALGGTALAIAGFNAQSAIAVPDVVVPPAPVPGEGTPVATPAEECQSQALSRPAHLSGRYQTYSVPNDNYYEVRFTLPPLPGCDAFGKRTVTVFQQKLEQYGYKPQLKWTSNGLAAHVATNQAKKVDVSFRASHLCWPEPAGVGNYDKKHHILVRPAIKEAWTPKDGGQPVSAVYNGSPALACK